MLSAARVPWLMLLLFYYLIQLLVSVIPLAGPLAMMVLRPVFTVGFLAAAWTQERGGMPEVRHLFRGFGANLWALLPIGIVLIVGTTFAVLSTALVDGGVLLDAITSNTKPRRRRSWPTRASKGAMLMAILVALPTLLAIWFAPALIVFQDCGPRQAMLTSLRAALANWRPVAVYGLLLFFCGAVVPGMAIAIISLLVPPAVAPYVIALTVVPYVFLFVAAQTISDYVAYRDIFHAGEGTPRRSPRLGNRCSSVGTRAEPCGKTTLLSRVARRQGPAALHARRPIARYALRRSGRLELRVFERQPLDAGVAKVDLHARVAAAPLGIDDDAQCRISHGARSARCAIRATRRACARAVAGMPGAGVIAATRSPHSAGSMSTAVPIRRRGGDSQGTISRGSSSRKRDAML